jgi:hypothetical protein
MSIGNEEFEAWARSKSLDLAYRNFPGIGKYYECPRTLLALETWKASRESLVIELPDYLDTEKLGLPAYDANAVDAAIEAAGLKVKP